jgi:glycine C-acetyltransferase
LEHAVARVLDDLKAELEAIRAQNLWKIERPILSAQSGHIRVLTDGGPRTVLNLCANNYLGLADDPRLIAAAMTMLDTHGLGMASVRFICGTSDVHRSLEERIARYVECEDAILYAACFDANGGLFEPLLGEQDAVISDSLNHASIIDGIRLCKARRYRYANGDMEDLEKNLNEARTAGARRILIATDGVFSMDGYFAALADIRGLADRFDALVMVDDCHATGLIGRLGRGTPARAGVKVDILTSTFGKALGGSAGGFIAAARPVIDLLRQRSRPYLFSNALPPALLGATLAAIDIAENGDDLRARLFENARRFRQAMTAAGFDLLPGEHPIIPVMLGEARLAQDMAAAMFDEGVYVTGFFYPVVPQGKARIRTQMSAALSVADIDEAVQGFIRVGRRMGLV